MRCLSLEELSHVAESFDDAVESMQSIDHFCSSSDWVLPAAQALMPEREARIYRTDDCFWAFMRGSHPDGFHYLEPLEAMWALSCPLIGSDISTLIDGLHSLCALPLSEWKILALSGLPTTHPLFAAIVENFADRLRLGLGQSSVRLVVDLDEGFDAFLDRRSKQFRRALKRSQRKAKEAGIRIVDASEGSPDELFSRIMAVEAAGWKGQGQVGITEGNMHEFYKLMLPRLNKRNAQRVLFAQLGSQDLAYILGGLRLGGYRGLQFSYDTQYREYGLGNLLQAKQIGLLCQEGASSYDLGMHMEYKLRWSDREHETVTLLLMRE